MNKSAPVFQGRSGFIKNMKRLFFLSCFFCWFVNSEAQNLVPNYSFENFSTCPTSGGQIWLADFWTEPNSGSPDYFNACASPSLVGVPDNNFGSQYAKTGNAYVGFWSFNEPYGSNVREYIQIQLTDTLIAGNAYCVSFFVSRAGLSRYAMSNFGALFTTTQVTAPSVAVLNYTPQVENPFDSIISDTTDWVEISGSFIAVGGEIYLTIGNFHNDANTNLQTFSNPISITYNYIDDVTVFLCSDTITPPPPVTENYLYVPNAFSPNGDGNNDFLFVRGKNIQELTFKVYDRWGQRVFETNNINEGWDGKYNGQEMENAVFVYYLTLTYADGKTEVKKGNVSLIR